MAVDNWALLKSYGQAEMEKWRWCRGCKYLSSAGCSGCCDYLLMTGKRRPCPIGNDCTVREYKKGYKPSDSHVAWCKEVDARLEEEQNTRDIMQRKIEKAVKDVPAVQLEFLLCKRSGIRSRSFDEEYAFNLYCHGFYISDIRDILDIPKWINLNAIAMNEWKKTNAVRCGVSTARHSGRKRKVSDLQSASRGRKGKLYDSQCTENAKDAGRRIKS